MTVIIAYRTIGRETGIECSRTSRVKRQDVQTKRISDVNLGLRREELNTVLSQRLISVTA